MDNVLVTGGSGFLGGWCIVQLLEQGYGVRTTVRSLSRETEVRQAIDSQVDASGLTFHEADLGADDGWAEAVAGCRYVIHVASPFPPAQPKDPDELIVPARDGALRVIGAALDAGVERIVMTSSVAAVRHPKDETEGHVYTEADWTDPDNTSLTPYVRSKTIAERAAWELVKSRGAVNRLATIEPGAIIGPALSADASYSLEVIQRLLRGLPAVPRLGFTFVDVRDTADLHIRALTSPDAAGQRYLAVDEWMWMIDVGAVLRERLGDAAKRVPTRVMPNLLVRAMAIFDPGIRSVVGDLGHKSDFDNSKSRSLGWSPRPIADSIAECGQSLIAHNAVT